MKYINIILKILLVSILILIIVVFVWAFRLRTVNPVSMLKQDTDSVAVIKDSLYITNLIDEERIYCDYTLSAGEAGIIQISASFPADSVNKNLPVVIILGGLEIGRESLTYVSNPGRNVIIVYQYPYSPEYWYEGSAITEIPLIQKSVLAVPSQVVALVKWIKNQSWADEHRICIAGYSFGGLFLPAVYHLAQHYGLILNKGVIAYGGVNNYIMLKKNLTNVVQPFRTIFAWLMATAIYPLDSMHHIEHVHNELLLISGKKDDQIPEECWRGLHQLTPEPKEIIILDEGHMHPRKEYLTKKLVDISQKWLMEKGSINP